MVVVVVVAVAVAVVVAHGLWKGDEHPASWGMAHLTFSHGHVVQDWERRREEDRLLIERLLIIIRNILHVPPNATRELVGFLLH